MRPNQTALSLKSFNQLCEKIHLTDEENWFISSEGNAIILSYVGNDNARLIFWFVKVMLRLTINGYFINPDDPFYRDIYMFEKDDIEFLKKNLYIV